MKAGPVMAAITALSLLVAVHGAWAQANPFMPGSTPGSSSSGLPGVRAPRWLSDVQRELNGRIAALARQAREEPAAAPVLLAFLTAVLFGMVHAVGPGHGKTFTLSYFLSANPRVGRGILFGGLISILDSVSSLAIVSAAYLVFRVALPSQATEGAAGLLQKVSYALIVAIGLWHLVSHLRQGHHHEHAHGGGTVRDARLWPLAISIGLVPCPIEVVVLVFGLSVGAFGFGVVLTLFVSLGQALALTLVALAAMGLRSGVLAVAGATARARVTRVLEVGGAALIVLFGAALLLAAL